MGEAELFQTDFGETLRQRFNQMKPALLGHLKNSFGDGLIINSVFDPVPPGRLPGVSGNLKIDDYFLIQPAFPRKNSDKAAGFQALEEDSILFCGHWEDTIPHGHTVGGEEEAMELHQISSALKKEQKRLRDFGVQSLALFGSTVRGEAQADSDLDFLVDFQGPATFDQYMGLRLFLEDLFGRPVDLVTRKGIRPPLASSIEREAQRVA